MLHTCLRVRGQQDQHDTRKSSFEQLAMMSAPILQEKRRLEGHKASPSAGYSWCSAAEETRMGRDGREDHRLHKQGERTRRRHRHGLRVQTMRCEGIS